MVAQLERCAGMCLQKTFMMMPIGKLWFAHGRQKGEDESVEMSVVSVTGARMDAREAPCVAHSLIKTVSFGKSTLAHGPSLSLRVERGAL